MLQQKVLLFFELLDEQAREVMTTLYPRSNPRVIHSQYLSLKLPRYTQGDVYWLEGDVYGHKYQQVSSFCERSNYSRPKSLILGELVNCQVVLSGWVHNKHQQRALCLTAKGW